MRLNTHSAKKENSPFLFSLVFSAICLNRQRFSIAKHLSCLFCTMKAVRNLILFYFSGCSL